MLDTESSTEPQVAAILSFPPKPDKWDIIPVHTSDRANFKRCRRYWDWTSPTRGNLSPNPTQLGIYFPFWFGNGIHYALEKFYDPVLKRDPVESFLTWYDVVWNGGVVSEEYTHLSYDTNPKVYRSETTDKGLFKVDGLVDLLFDPDPTIYEEHRELGVGMLTYYKEYAAREDRFRVIATEHDFSIPLDIEAVDWRDGKTKQVHYRGRMDAIVQDLESGQYGIIDHKTAESVSEDYFSKLETDEQCTSYLWAAQQEAQMYDLPYKKVDFIIYNVMRKAFPKPPSVLKDGIKPSIDRQGESTTYDMFMQHIESNGLRLIFDTNEKWQGYANYLKETGDELFIIRKDVRRNKYEMASAEQRIKAEVMDMIEDPRIYPNFRGSRDCTRCSFRMPCLAKEDGSDWEMFITDNYVNNSDR